ncbi:longevity assurance proteins LAG1/LAC1 [Aspergillus pseudodeflectus]|uniref:Longevity assurance proteins LAG1/LAC1 n=1 Tax=Aspergillus pseudodeflectus TaxID=176178 RepID=A0ABR4K2I4_9EURO
MQPTPPVSKAARWVLNHQIGLSVGAVALALLAHACLPTARRYTSVVLLVSHYNPETQRYAIGRSDAYFLAFCIVLFTGLRASFIKYALAPLAKRWGIFKPRDVTRFSEQAWLLCYYSVFWTLGLYIYCTSKYFLNLREMFTDWPTRELPGLIKFYILGQWAFWLQQLIIVNIEERRKDHLQMVAHHLVTILLIYTSYTLHLTRVANVILVLMDVVDIFFPLAKCLKYAGFSALRDTMFGIFMLSWFLARHVFYCITMWSIFTHMPQEISIGCYRLSHGTITGPTPLPQGWAYMLEPFRNPTGTICYSDGIRWGFLGALGFLQLLTIIWFMLIVRVAIRVVKGLGADDIRSDDEGGEDVEINAALESDPEARDEDRGLDSERKQHLLELSAGHSNCKSCTHRHGTVVTNRAASSSGISLSKHHNRKELLGRIGCEKQVD